MSAQRVGYTGKGQNSVMGKGDSVTKKVWIEVDIENGEKYSTAGVPNL